MRTWYHFVLPDEEGSESWLSLGLVVLAGGIVTAKTNWRSFHMLAITSLEGLARPKSFRHGGGTLSLRVPTLARTLEYPPEGLALEICVEVRAGLLKRRKEGK